MTPPFPTPPFPNSLDPCNFPKPCATRPRPPLRICILPLLAALLLSLLAAISPSRARAAATESPVALQPLSIADGPFTTVTLDGRVCWQAADFQGRPAPFMYFKAPSSFQSFQSSQTAQSAQSGAQPLYLQVFLRDTGVGRLEAEYDSAVEGVPPMRARFQRAEASCETRLFGGGAPCEAVFKLEKPRLRGGQQGGADLRLRAQLREGRLTVERALLWTTPPPLFTQSTAQPWFGAYTGPSRSDVDRSTLDGKVLCGYQGWFGAPHDGSGGGYIHWGRDSFRLGPGLFTVDMWPDLAEYDPADLFAVPGLKMPDGSPARVYSAYRKSPVLLHCKWMRQYGIDGVFMSRFTVQTLSPDRRRHADQVLANVREGCNREGRVWAMMLDVSGPAVMTTQSVVNDWIHLCDDMKIREDGCYLYHQGKPVVLLWGFGFADRFWTPRQAAQVIDFFKHGPKYGGVYLIGGIDPSWRTLRGGSRREPEWAAVYRSFDSISVWDAGRYRDDAGLERHRRLIWEPDLAETKKLGLGYMPTVFPGFSWDNLKGGAPGSSGIPRRGGEFYWRQFHHLASLGVRTVFVGMFDEIDEGTAIYKVTNTPPAGAHFVTYEGLPSDWYLRLTGAATRMVRGEIAPTPNIPQPLPGPRK